MADTRDLKSREVTLVPVQVWYPAPFSGRSSVWLERVIWDHEAAGSSPVVPTI